MAEKPSWRISKPFQLQLSIAHERRGAKPVMATLTGTHLNGMVVEVPRDFCSQGQNVTAEVETVGAPDGEIHLKIRAKVSRQTLDNAHPGMGDTVELTFEKWDADSWLRLCDLYANRQAEVERAFDALKG
jgi:hypothetical protein